MRVRGDKMKAKSYLASRTEVVKFVLPEHLNGMGNMHGGEIMKFMDDTAGLSFVKHSEGNAVTAAANNIRFIKPIPAKSIVKCVSELVKTGRTSMQVATQVYIENVKTGESILAADAIFVGVAIDEQGKPRPVAPVIIDKTKIVTDANKVDA